MAKIYISAVIAHPVDAVWKYLRDFNGLPNFMPPVADSVIEDGRPADQIGCVRNFHMKDGGHLREQLLALSDVDRFQTYSILLSPMPLKDYVATVRCLPITATGQTFAEWTASFEATDGDDRHWVEHIGTNVFAAAFANLEKVIGAK
jgi:hypothetical protein